MSNVWNVFSGAEGRYETPRYSTSSMSAGEKEHQVALCK